MNSSIHFIISVPMQNIYENRVTLFFIMRKVKTTPLTQRLGDLENRHWNYLGFIIQLYEINEKSTEWFKNPSDYNEHGRAHS